MILPNQKHINLIRELREKLYWLTEHRSGQERVWEEDDVIERRKEQNRLARKAWDEETEKMIFG